MAKRFIRTLLGVVALLTAADFARLAASAQESKAAADGALPVERAVDALIEKIPPSAPASGKQDLDRAAIRQIVNDYLAELEAARASESAKATALTEPSNNPPLASSWENQLTFISPNKDWRIHLGGRFQFQNVFFQEPKKLEGPQPGPGGIPAARPGDGIGTLEDGAFFRRVRFRADGTAYENVEFMMEVDFEQLNYVTFDHMWAGMKDIPFLGTVRIGQHKVPQGLEMMASDYQLTFLEDRSALFDAFWTLFAPGILIANNFADDNVSFQTMFHRIQPLGFYTGDFGDGQYAETTRLTWTPYYKDDGRYLVHVGGSYQIRSADLGRTFQPGATGNAYADSQRVVRFRARDEIRDATGIGSVGNGVLGGNVGRMIDTGYLLASNVQNFCPEFLVNWGPFAVQAEAVVARVADARSIYPSSQFNTPRGSPVFWGGYVETSYFLTGENRGYDRRFGVPDRPKVLQNYFLARGEDGRLHWGLGAWQIAYRYSFVDLNDNGIDGGQLISHSIGLNWFLNDNLKMQFMYNNATRNVAGPAVSGTVNGFGALLQWYF